MNKLPKSFRSGDLRDWMNARQSTSGTSKRLLERNENNNEICRKKQRFDDSMHEIRAHEKTLYAPIASLSPMQSCPPIRAQLISVSDWRTTCNGSYFSNFILRDSSGEIDGVIFRSSLTDFKDKFVIGATLTISKAAVKPVRPNYRGQSRSEFEISISNKLNTVEIESVEQEDTGPSAIDTFSRILIKDVMENNIEPQQLVDVMGVVVDVENIRSTVCNGQNTLTRDFHIIDESSMKIAVTVWRKKAKIFDSPVGTVVAMYQVLVRVRANSNIKSLTFQRNSRFEINPPVEATERLKNWYNQWKSNNESSLSQEYHPSFARPGSQYSNRSVTSTNTMNPTRFVKYSPTSIKEVIERLQPNDIIDTVGLVTEVLKAEQFQTRNGRLKYVSNIKITDELGNDIWVEIWRNNHVELDIPLHAVVMCRKAMVKLYRDEKKLSTFHDQVYVNPDIPEAQRLGNIVSRQDMTSPEQAYLASLQKYVRDVLVTRNYDHPPYRTIKMIDEECQTGTIVDIVGLVKFVDSKLSQSYVNKKSKSTRRIILRDLKSYEIELVIWGCLDTQCNIPVNSIVVAKDATIFIGDETKKLSIACSNLNLFPDMDELLRLEEIFMNSPVISTPSRCIFASNNGNSSTSENKEINERVKNIFAVEQNSSQPIPPIIDLTIDDRVKNISVFEKNSSQSTAPTVDKIINEEVENIHDVEQKLSQLISPTVDLTIKEDILNKSAVEKKSYQLTAPIVDKTIDKSVENISVVEKKSSQLNPRTDEIFVESNFTKINVINEKITGGAIIDVLGVIKRRYDLQTIECWDGNTVKLTVELIDDSLQTISMVIWGKRAKNLEKRKNLIIAAKKVTVRYWQSVKEINCTDRKSILIVEPEIKEARDLQNWYKLHCHNRSIKSNVTDAPITLIANLQHGETSSILGILKRKGKARVIMEEHCLDVTRTIEIIDNSGKTMRIILWGERARDFEIDEEAIILATNVKIIASNDTTNGSFTPNSCLKIDPPEFRENVERLKRWFARYKLYGCSDICEELKNADDCVWSENDD